MDQEQLDTRSAG